MVDHKLVEDEAKKHGAEIIAVLDELADLYKKTVPGFSHENEKRRLRMASSTFFTFSVHRMIDAGMPIGNIIRAALDVCEDYHSKKTEEALFDLLSEFIPDIKAD